MGVVIIFVYFFEIRQDRSSTGHVLGRAQPQQRTVQSERNLNPLSCGVLRCLTHLAMLLGTDRDTQVCLFKARNIYFRSSCLAFSKHGISILDQIV